MNPLTTPLAVALADRYRIERELGQGGMATVYLAHDLKHDRQVAIKVLRPELAAVIGAERFLSEIRTTANLQHPHILPLFDSGVASTAAESPNRAIAQYLYYVMPFIEGESLRDRLTREKQLPIADAVRIASEVASALDYAHRHGVIHRDIKPENILLHDGQALVADFGIALAASKAGGVRMTETGMSLGTPHYMSPEQAMGEREITARSDIYALGCVTYEMLLGEPPFTGPTAQAIVAKVMTAEAAPPGQIRRSVPPAVDHAVMTALEKLPADRWGSAAEFAEAMVGTASATQRAAASGASASLRGPVIVLGALLGIVSTLAAWGWLRGSTATPAGSFGAAHKVTSDPGLEIQPAISPDGRSVAYAAGTSVVTRIYVRPVAGGRQIPITDDSTEVQSLPTWSPDGTRILFLSHGGVFSAPASGGPAHPEIPAGRGNPVSSAEWSPDGSTIAYVAGDSLFLRAGDGTVRLLAGLLEPAECTWSPDGTLLACASGNARYLAVGTTFGNLSPSRIVICRVADRTLVTATDSTSLNQAPTWSPDGRRLYFISDREGPRDIFAMRIGRDGRPEERPTRLTVGLGAQSISLSHDGRHLAYNLFSATGNIWSLPLPTGGPLSESQAVQVTRGSQVVEEMRLSADEQWLYYDSNLGGHSDLYRLRLPRGEPERLTADSSDDFAPAPSPDGREVAFHSWRLGSRDVYVMPLDGGPRQQVTSSPMQEAAPDWSPDGSALAFTDFTARGGIWVVRRRPDGGWSAPVRRLTYGLLAAWSVDGRFLAFSSSLDGHGSLGVVPVDSGPVRILVDPARTGQPSTSSGFWGLDGRTIYFKGLDARGIASFWSIPAAGGTARQLVRLDDPLGPSYRPTWSLGSRRIYFTIDDRQSDVWVMETDGL